MNKSFILLDRRSDIQRNASSIVKFNFGGKEYLIYSIDENEQNDHIFVSRLVMNSEGKTFIDNILPEEKGKLNNIVYNIVILIPSEAQKGVSFDILSSDLYSKFSVELSLFSSDMEIQEYYHDCSVAITSKILVESAIKYYESNLNKKVEEIVSVPTWTSPVEVTAPVPTDEEIKIPESVINSVQESIINPVQGPVVMPVQEPVVDVNIQSNIVEPVNAASTATLDIASQSVVAPSVDVSTVNHDVNQKVQENAVEASVQQSNPQIEKLAIVSDPSLGIGVSQPNVIGNEKAGFANSKYIILGSVCLVLAIVVVVVAYFLIRNIK